MYTNEELDLLQNVQLINLIKELEKENEYLQENVKEQIHLNANLIRISKERSSQADGRPCKSNGFRIEMIKECNHYDRDLGQTLRYFKVRIRTPYATEAFSLAAAKLQLKIDKNELQGVLTQSYEAVEQITPMMLYKKENVFWDELWEGDFGKKGVWHINVNSLQYPLLF